MEQHPNRIRELRLEKRWSQDQLAEAVGCSKMQISGLERGRPRLDIDWMRRIAAALDVAPSDLLPLDDQAIVLSDKERELIETFRRGTVDQREALGRVVDALMPITTLSVNDNVRLPKDGTGA